MGGEGQAMVQVKIRGGGRGGVPLPKILGGKDEATGGSRMGLCSRSMDACCDVCLLFVKEERAGRD